MPIRAIIGWTTAVWLAVGVQAAWGGGVPGPVFVVALAAGLWSGPAIGLCVGAGAGLCDAVLWGQHVIPLALIGMSCGLGAGLLRRQFSRRHILVAMLAALVCSFLFCLPLAWPHQDGWRAAVWLAARRGGENALWMLLIYGIVLVTSPRASMPVSGVSSDEKRAMRDARRGSAATWTREQEKGVNSSW